MVGGLSTVAGSVLVGYAPVSYTHLDVYKRQVVSLVIGVTAGVYPAGRAARLAPIDALRSE